MSSTRLSIFPCFFFSTGFSPDFLAWHSRPSLMSRLLSLSACYLLYQIQIKLCQTHSYYVPVPMSSWSVLCPEYTSLPSLSHLLDSYPAFRTWLGHLSLLKPLLTSTLPPSRQGRSSFPRTFTPPQTSLFSSTCRTHGSMSAFLTDCLLPLSLQCLGRSRPSVNLWVYRWWIDLSLGRAYPEVRSSYIPLCGFHSMSERALSQRRRKCNLPQCEESFFLVSRLVAIPGLCDLHCSPYIVTYEKIKYLNLA